MNTEKPDFSFLLLQYQALSGRQQMHNTFVWNVPALLFTAESILWGISFGDVPNEIRCCISFISALVAFASWQQFERGRLMEIADAEQLYAIEQAMKDAGIWPLMIVYHKLDKRTLLVSGKEQNLWSNLTQKNYFPRHNPLAHIRTFLVWRVMFAIVFLFSALLFVYNLCLT